MPVHYRIFHEMVFTMFRKSNIVMWEEEKPHPFSWSLRLYKYKSNVKSFIWTTVSLQNKCGYLLLKDF